VKRQARRQDLLAADGTRLALYAMGPLGGTPVLLIPGTFSNHTFWMGTRGHGMAWSLAESGFEVAVLDPRGHGGSERAAGRPWNFEDWGRLDVPAALDAVTHTHPRAFLVGHSAGGAALLMALAGEPDLRSKARGVVVLATPVPWLQRWRRMGAWGIRVGSRLLGRFPARLLRLGPEDELPGVMAQWMAWNLEGRWIGDEGTDYVERLAALDLPILGMSGAGDTVFAPPDACQALVAMMGGDDRTYLLAGRETGFDEDFDHAGLVVSRAARAQVWPRVLDWLRERA
jgi:predicted alpha/beta hydrolase